MVLLESKMMPLGRTAPDFALKGIDDEIHNLADYERFKVLVIIFMCNHCPYVQKIWDDLVVLANSFPNDVQFIGINSNPAYPEDSFEKMKTYAHEKGQNFPYLFDENQKVAKSYGAECTPDFFMYDLSRKLQYRGGFDGLGLAINSSLNDNIPSMDQKPSMGCSIKWV